jgi:hypothetical protein
MVVRILAVATPPESEPLGLTRPSRRMGRDAISFARRQSPRIDLAAAPTYKPRNLTGSEIKRRETHLSTIEARPQAPPRLPRAHGDGRRPQGVGQAAGEGA